MNLMLFHDFVSECVCVGARVHACVCVWCNNDNRNLESTYSSIVFFVNDATSSNRKEKVLKCDPQSQTPSTGLQHPSSQEAGAGKLCWECAPELHVAFEALGVL